MGKIPKKGEIPKIQGKKTPAFNQTWLKGYFCWTNVYKVGQDIKIYISIVCFFFVRISLAEKRQNWLGLLLTLLTSKGMHIYYSNYQLHYPHSKRTYLSIEN